MKAIIILIVVVLTAVSASAQKVKVEADRTADTSKYKTYAWAKGMPIRNPLIQQMIVDAVDRQLAAKGLMKVADNGDLTVVSLAAIDADLQTSYPSSTNAMGSAPSTGIAVGSQMWTVTRGMLVVDISDAATKNMVWRGTATDTLSEGPSGSMAKDAKTVEKPIKKAVEKMFKQYPHP